MSGSYTGSMSGEERHGYRGVGDLGRDLSAVARHPSALLRLLRGRSVGPAFRERLMLIVSGVHVCPYCIRLHGSLARRAGVSRAEVDRLLHGLVGDAPRAELGALAYALHWAESDGRPEVGARRELEQRYGTKPAAEIAAALRLIRIGNLTGNALRGILPTRLLRR